MEEICYVTEQKWIRYCKGIKRKTYQGLPVCIILENEGRVVTAEHYWQEKEQQKQEQSKKRWKASNDKEYYRITARGQVSCCRCNDDGYDKGCYEMGNMFETKEEASEEAKRIKYNQMYKDYALTHNDEIDWNNGKQYKYYAAYNYALKEIVFDYWGHIKTQGVVYFTDVKYIYDFIELIGEDNFKKYILGVGSDK